jgi:thiol:disulfide interchange protein DsbD
MKKTLVLILALVAQYSFAQILNPVKWELSVVPVEPLEYELVFTANIEKNWAIYSQFLEEGGPLPTVISFEASPFYETLGAPYEKPLNKVTKHDAVFEMVVSKFYKRAVFVQRIKIIEQSAFDLIGNVEYMTCDDSRCTYKPDNPFAFNYTPAKGLAVASASKIETEIISENANVKLYGMQPDQIKHYSEVSKSSRSLWRIFALGVLGGLLALLTPCVFPMIPLTVSFFTKKTDDNSGFMKALLYGLFIVLVYLILSTPFHLLDSVNPDILNEISTNVWLNVIFFLIFIIFAFSFFGYYELTLPSKWTNFTSQGEGVGGILGVFFMALTLSIVSFSCTGPILGSLLAGSLSSNGGAWQLTAGMGGFGVALGFPFALFAMFPNMLKALPKSGGWLNTTKVVLGFLELALAFKFLSNADLVQHWGLLKIEVFLAIWILIFLGLTLYIFGVLKFPHDGPIRKRSFLRISSGLLVFAFVVYLGSGFKLNDTTKTFTPLTLLSGLAPPVGHSILYPNDTPNNFKSFKDFKKGVAYAQKVNKPILLDFTGYACVNCRKMEEIVWSKPSIAPYFENEYVLISLYVDDKKALPEAQKISVERLGGGTRTLTNFGHKWAHFQTEFFQSNSQPFYVLLSPDAKIELAPKVGYTPDVKNYEAFLKLGLEAFKAL